MVRFFGQAKKRTTGVWGVKPPRKETSASDPNAIDCFTSFAMTGKRTNDEKEHRVIARSVATKKSIQTNAIDCFATLAMTGKTKNDEKKKE